MRILVAGVALVTAPIAFAERIYVDVGSGLEIVFSLPALDPSHNGFVMGAAEVYAVGTIVQASLYDEVGLLGTKVSEFIFPGFVDPSSPFSGKPSTVDIDFSRLADGTPQGRLVLIPLEVPGIVSGFEVDSDRIYGFGFSSPGIPAVFEASIISVSKFVTIVPEPRTLLMSLVGILVVFYRAYRVRCSG
jgi:hypothetical protein